MNVKTKLSLILLLVIFSQTHLLQAQNEWGLRNPTPSHLAGKDVHFVSNNVGYIITNSELLETLDSGESWQIKQVIPNANDLSFYNNTGIVVGNNGYVLKTLDGGATWNTISSGTSEDLNSVSFISESVIMVTSDASLLKTDDGGSNWTSLPMPNAVVNKSFFTSELVGHAACNDGEMYKTIDGGENWYITLDIPNSPTDFFTVYFLNENVGFSSAEHTKVFKTIDGGETWLLLSSISDAIYAFYFLDEDRGYAAGNDGVIFKTVDGGNLWNWASFQPNRTYNTDVYGLYFFNFNTGYATGARGRIVKTNFAGLTWDSYAPTYNRVKQLDFVSSDIGYALVDDSFYKSVDGGLTWNKIGTPFPGLWNYKFDFIDENIGFTIVGDALVYKTTDGGITWQSTNNGNEIIGEDLYSIDFVDQNIGYVSGGFNQDAVVKTNDGGDTWQQLATISFSEINFINEQIGYGRWVGGSTRSIQKTTDGGFTWNNVLTYNHDINSMFFLDENNGYATGDDGFMRKTTDGGMNWQNLSLPFHDYIAVDFYSNDIGYIVEDYGRIFKTTNAGLDWEQIIQLIDIEDLSIFEDDVYAYGDWGKIFKSNAIGPLGITEINANTPFLQLHPNPSENVLIVTTKENASIKSIVLFDYAGKKVIDTEFIENSTEVQLNVSKLSSGVYIVNARLENGSVGKGKIIIK